MKIRNDLRTVNDVQLVYSNHQDIALTLFTEFNIRLVYKCQIEEYHQTIKIVRALLLYNACTLPKMMDTYVTNNNKLKIYPRGMATFKKMREMFLQNLWLHSKIKEIKHKFKFA